MTTEPLQAGDQLHFFKALVVPITSGLFTGRSEILGRGDTLILTSGIIEANTDANGNTWFDLADDPDAQVRRWGSVMFGRGPWPDDQPKLLPGTVEWGMARDRAHAVASAEPDEGKRIQALRAVAREYPETTSRTLSVIASDTEIAERRAAAARAGGR